MSDAVTTVKHLEKDQVDVRLHCPACGILSRVESRIFNRLELSNEIQYSAVVTCPSPECRRTALLVVHDPYNHLGSFGTTCRATVYPPAHVLYDADGVPKQISEEFSEALGSASSGFYIGAALVGRRVLQAAAREVLGGKGGSLQDEIEAIPDDRLNKALKKQAHEVRLIGNEAAHVDPVDPADVEELLDFVEQVLEALYVSPKRLQDLQDKRAKTKAARTAAAAKATAAVAPTVPAAAQTPAPLGSGAPAPATGTK